MITEFRHENRYLSNFWICPVMVAHPSCSPDCLFTWASSEHAYQAMKTREPDEINALYMASGPLKAKRLGREVTMREDWALVRKQFMLSILLAKFTQNQELGKLLTDTAPRLLVEGNTWHDNYWGQCTCRSCFGSAAGPGYVPELFHTALVYPRMHPGKNYLGKLLMAVRDVLVED